MIPPAALAQRHPVLAAGLILGWYHGLPPASSGRRHAELPDAPPAYGNLAERI